MVCPFELTTKHRFDPDLGLFIAYVFIQ
jgi:hypothetical protein